jgi:hypothetical protein
MQFARLEAGPALAGGPPLTTIYVQRFHRGCPTLAFVARVGGDGACAIGFVT